jgi:hypothetical protein
MSEAFKKVGRGGAGNFYSKKDVEDVKGKGKAAVCPLFLSPLLKHFNSQFPQSSTSKLNSVLLFFQLCNLHRGPFPQPHPIYPYPQANNLTNLLRTPNPSLLQQQT